jgi:hypothetical protein
MAFICDSCGEKMPVNPATGVLPNGWTRIELARNGVPPATHHLCSECSGGARINVTRAQPFAKLVEEPVPRALLGAGDEAPIETPSKGRRSG